MTTNPVITKLRSRLIGYAASAGAVLALTPLAKGEVIYSGPRNINLWYPDDVVEIDLNGDNIYDFGFLMAGSTYLYQAGIYFYAYRSGYGGIFNARTDGYSNSWMVRNSYVYFTNSLITYTYPVVLGLYSGEMIHPFHSIWSDATYYSYPGILAAGYMSSFYYSQFNFGSYRYFYGDFVGEERYIGIRFYIGNEQHYGWIRAVVDNHLVPLTIIDWAYDTNPYTRLHAGDIEDVTPPDLYFSGGGGVYGSQAITITLNSDEPVTGFGLNDLVVSNGNVSDLSEQIPGKRFSFTVTAIHEGQVEVVLPAGRVEDLAFNTNLRVSTSWTFSRPNAAEVSESPGVAIYPNPASSELNVILDELSDIQIISVKGETIMVKHAVLKETFDVSKFSPGMYIVRIIGRDTISRHKILIE